MHPRDACTYAQHQQQMTSTRLEEIFAMRQEIQLHLLLTARITGGIPVSGRDLQVIALNLNLTTHSLELALDELCASVGSGSGYVDDSEIFHAVAALSIEIYAAAEDPQCQSAE